MQKINLIISFLITLFRRKKKLITITFLAGLVFLIVIFRFNSFLPSPVLVEGVVGTYEEHNIPPIVLRLISSSLVKINEKGEVIGDLSLNWEANEKGTEYILKLKDDLKWVDGSPIKAGDIAITIPEVKVEALDDKTIKFTLADSYSPFPSLLNHPVLKKDSLIGTGPYRIDKIQKDGIFIKKLTLKSMSADLPQLTIKFYPNEKIAKNALKLGEIQALMGLNDLSGINLATYNIFAKTNKNQLVTIFYNTQDEILSDENFRLALSFAAPSIKDELEAKTSIPPDSWAFNSETKDFLDNPEQSKIYLDKVKHGQDSTITLTATSTLKNIGEAIVSEWTRNGIKAVLRIESGIPQNFQALLITQNIPPDPDQYSLWHSTQTSTNISRLSSPRVDKDLEDGRKLVDTDKRKQKYLDFQKILSDNAPATFLYFPKYKVVYLRKVDSLIQKVVELQVPNR